MALLTLRGCLTLTPGVGYCILEAFLYSTAILVTDRLTHAGADPLLSGVVQVGFLGALALIASFLFETPHLPGSGTEWLVVLALALVCSGFGFTLQPVAQSGTTADSIPSLRQRWARCAFTSTLALRACSAAR